MDDNYWIDQRQRQDDLAYRLEARQERRHFEDEVKNDKEGPWQEDKADR